MSTRFWVELVEDVERAWPRAEPFVERILARAHGEYELSDVRELVNKGIMNLWIGKENNKVRAVLLGDVRNYPRIRAYRIWGFSADDLQFWLPHLSVIEAHVKDHGFDHIEAVGRRGWAKVLDGWQEVDTIMRKPL